MFLGWLDGPCLLLFAVLGEFGDSLFFYNALSASKRLLAILPADDTSYSAEEGFRCTLSSKSLEALKKTDDLDEWPEEMKRVLNLTSDLSTHKIVAKAVSTRGRRIKAAAAKLARKKKATRKKKQIQPFPRKPRLHTPQPAVDSEICRDPKKHSKAMSGKKITQKDFEALLSLDLAKNPTRPTVEPSSGKLRIKTSEPDQEIRFEMLWVLDGVGKPMVRFA